MNPRLIKAYEYYNVVVRSAVMGLAYIAGTAVCVMVAVTCVDVVLRRLGSPLHGALDIVTIAGTIAIGGAMPYTTAVKGHVSIEYFFHKLSRKGRIVVDTFSRLIGITLFIYLTRQFAQYGTILRASGRVMPTLQTPVFWMPYMLSVCCALVTLVILHNMLHPNRKMVKP